MSKDDWGINKAHEKLQMAISLSLKHTGDFHLKYPGTLSGMGNFGLSFWKPVNVPGYIKWKHLLYPGTLTGKYKNFQLSQDMIIG